MRLINGEKLPLICILISLSHLQNCLTEKMPRYRLIYYNAKGLAETSRFVLAQAGVDYVDKRMTSEEVPEFKSIAPYGSFPVLEVDGRALADSRSIARYLAEEYDLAGSNSFENAEIDSIVGVANDLFPHLASFWFEKDETRKAELRKEVEETHVPRYFGALEKRAAANNCTTEGWIYGAKVTWADFRLAIAIELFSKLFPDAMSSFPALLKLRQAVEKLPRIAKWISERPVTDN